MPELPEITVLARQMQAELVGRSISGAEIVQPKCLNVAPELFVDRLTGATIVEVTSRGKWILVETSRGWLLLSLGMGGEILLITRASLPEKRQLILDLDQDACLAIHFWWFGYAHYAPLGELDSHPMTARLGPDALGLTLEQFRESLRGRRGAIKSLLLDQSRIAGIGNVYIQDPLFAAGVHPLRAVSSLTEDEVAALWQALQDTLQQSVDLGGSAWEQDLYGRKGRWDASYLRVGYREGQPCPACGTLVEKTKTGSTSGFICPRCQPLGQPA